MGQKVPVPPIRDTVPQRITFPKISKKFSPWKIYHFKILQPPTNITGVHTLKSNFFP